jgi:predicted dehydrogenase
MPTRREFVRSAAVAGAAVAARGLPLAAASDQLRVALIGCGGRGRQVLSSFVAQPDVRITAVCDVYAPFREKAAAVAPEAVAVADYRRVLDRQDVDAVIVATPDHWHALQTVHACAAGKDVYVEKPLSLTVREGRAMVQAARTHRRVVQTGSQQRSGPHYAKARDLIRAGAIGNVHHVSAGFARNAMPGFVAREIKGGLPGTLDWDMWLGPAPAVPFDPFRCIYHFRWFWPYSGGQMTNWGAHHLDIARWVLGADGASSVSGLGGRYAIRDGGETPDVQEVLYDFPGASLGAPGCVVTWSAREIGRGRGEPLEFHGTTGTLSVDRRGVKITPEGWEGDGEDRKTPKADPLDEQPAPDLTLLHVRNFLDCVKSRAMPVADVEEGHRSAAMCHLGNIATRLRRSIRWDPVAESIAGDPEAAGLLHYEYRAPWRLDT